MVFKLRFSPRWKLIPESGISSLKTNCAVSQMDNAASNTCANRQIYLQNLQNASLKSVYNAACHRLYRHCIHRFALPFLLRCVAFLYRSFTFCVFSQWLRQLKFLFKFLNFLTALPFFLFFMFFMFKGILSVFCFTVVLFFSVCMF